MSDHIDAELYELLLRKAGVLLARRAYSRGELGARLERIARGSPIESVLDRLEQLNLLNDADYAYNFALRRIEQEGWSPARVRNSLLRRKVAQRTVEIALERIRNELGNESVLLTNCVRSYCGKKGLPADPKAIRKLVLYLRQRGFEEEEIIETLRQMIPAAAWQQFETGE